jgi:hypothetical protein
VNEINYLNKKSCLKGYYGRPHIGQGCKECMCPGGSNGNQFAATCYIEDRSDRVICECKKGYVSDKCDKCDVFYWGNPLVLGGSCKRCECNGNVDENNPESCDQNSGECKKCMYNTDGPNCEKCKPGFYGNASNHDCRRESNFHFIQPF